MATFGLLPIGSVGSSWMGGGTKNHNWRGTPKLLAFIWFYDLIGWLKLNLSAEN